MSDSRSLFPHSPFQIPEYCQTLDEEAVLENSFDLIFAFDEIVALGYRESVNLAQIRTFTGGWFVSREQIFASWAGMKRALGWFLGLLFPRLSVCLSVCVFALITCAKLCVPL